MPDQPKRQRFEGISRWLAILVFHVGYRGKPCKVCGFHKAAHLDHSLEFDMEVYPCSRYTLRLTSGNPLKARAKLKIRRGRVLYKIYQQDGTMQEMTCKDTPDNRLYVSWIKAHDRYGRPK